MDPTKRFVLGIDFGTTHSLACAISPEGEQIPIQLDPGASDPTVMPSLIYFPNADEVHYGTEARQKYLANEFRGRLLKSFKRFLPNRSFIGTFVDNRPLNFEIIVGLFLRRLKELAQEQLEVEIDDVVIGRPAQFSMDESAHRFACERLLQGARWAGFKQVELVPEPLAAARGGGLEFGQDGKVLICDLGGGTSDFTVLNSFSDPSRESEVLAVHGLNQAGDALDGCVMRDRISFYFGSQVQYQVPFGSNILKMPRMLVEKLCRPAELTILMDRDTREFFQQVQSWSLGDQDQEAIDRLFTLTEDQLGYAIFDSIESCKRELSHHRIASCVFSYPTIEINEEISRQEFNLYTHDVVKLILKSLDETIQLAKLQPAEISRIYATGGTAYVPIFKEKICERFPQAQYMDLDPYRSVVRGLANEAARIYR